jgi:hypothetical protein
MRYIKPFIESNQVKNFIEIGFLDEILNSVKSLLPKDLKYIRLYNKTVGFQQGSLEMEFYNSGWRVIDLIEEFNEEQQEIYGGEVCLSDYISNSLVGLVHDCELIDWKHTDEFYNKIQMDKEYYYIVK